MTKEGELIHQGVLPSNLKTWSKYGQRGTDTQDRQGKQNTYFFDEAKSG